MDRNNLTPIQELMLEVLAARFMLGEHEYTFSRKFFAAANALGIMKLVEWTRNSDGTTIQVRLTSSGRKSMHVSPHRMKSS